MKAREMHHPGYCSALCGSVMDLCLASVMAGLRIKITGRTKLDL